MERIIRVGRKRGVRKREMGRSREEGRRSSTSYLESFALSSLFRCWWWRTCPRSPPAEWCKPQLDKIPAKFEHCKWRASYNFVRQTYNFQTISYLCQEVIIQVLQQRHWFEEVDVVLQPLHAGAHHDLLEDFTVQHPDFGIDHNWKNQDETELSSSGQAVGSVCVEWCELPLMDAVLVQLYKMASSPNALHEPIFPRTLLSLITSNSPSAETNKCAPASPSLITYESVGNSLGYMESTSSLTCEWSKFFRKSLSKMASLMSCLDLKVNRSVYNITFARRVKWPKVLFVLHDGYVCWLVSGIAGFRGNTLFFVEEGRRWLLS